MINCVIFDIDGTLANVEHRIHWVRSKPKNWPAFNRGMVRDTPNQDICDLLRMFHAAGTTILIASGRSEDDREVTERRLRDVAGLDELWARLYMRPSKDHRSDDIIKGEILDQMIQEGFNPTMAIDDRDQVVAMLRARGLRVLQVAEGNF